VDGVVSEQVRTGRPAPGDERRGLEILAVSDDLTGAAALAGEFHAAGLDSCVAPVAQPAGGGRPVDALVVDSRSRQMPAADAARTVRRALTRRDERPRAYFKRIDSAVRGNVAAELDAVADALGRTLVLATAAPALGVATRDGVQRPASLDAPLSTLLGRGAVEIPLDEVRGPRLPDVLAAAVGSGRHVVCDGESDADLMRVATALAPVAERAVPVGSYGFGRAWATTVAGPRDRAPGVLAVVGSLKDASRLQVDLARDRGALTVFDAADSPVDPAAALAGGDDVVLVAAPDGWRPDRGEDPGVAGRLAERAVAMATTHGPRGLVLVGGDLASAFFERAGVHAGRVVVEPWPAAPVLRLHGGVLDGRLVLTKSGAQGDDAWLDRAIATMRGLGRAATGAADA
jgi:4-hydroxythreonine-4-phosphate dehydrogenase